MGLMDRVKAQATQLAQQAQETAREGRARLDQAQANKRADVLLRNLGVLVYAEQTSRGTPQSEEQIVALIGEISAHEAENGINLALQPTGWPAPGGSGGSAGPGGPAGPSGPGGPAGPSDPGGSAGPSGPTTFPPPAGGTTFPESGSSTVPEPGPDATFGEPSPDATFRDSDPGTSFPPEG